MASPKAPVLGAKGGKKEHALDEAIFAAEVKSHLVHEAVRAEANARRAGTAQTKSRSMVSGGRSKPWRQKGTGRARAGTIRAPQFEGGGHAFAKVVKAAFRSALATHASAGSIAIVDSASFESPSTKQAAALIDGFELETPIVLVCLGDESNLAKSFRNLDRVAVVQPSELEVGAVVWARSLLVTEAALPIVEGRAR
jgi:large subunit ribosomal protein L4